MKAWIDTEVFKQKKRYFNATCISKKLDYQKYVYRMDSRKRK
jgi:hypothetical protein